MRWRATGTTLQVLLAIGRAGSLTGEALLLDVDQSTASRRLASLGVDPGCILFVRLKAGFAPTKAGAAAIARALEVEGRALRLVKGIAKADKGPVGLVRLSGNP